MLFASNEESSGEVLMEDLRAFLVRPVHLFDYLIND